MVTYDYQAGTSVPIPEATRALLAAHRRAASAG